jgi:hypothetical protein
VTDEELVAVLEKQRAIMVAVATGGPRIDDANFEYKQMYALTAAELAKRSIRNPNPYADLWEWYGRWSNGDLPSWQSRRQLLAEMFNPTIVQLRNRAIGQPLDAVEELTGWPKVDRTVGEIRKRLAEAQDEEHFQAVGLLCRESLISLAQAVYDKGKHPPLDGVQPSETDAKRMLDGYLAVELPGSSNEVARRHARASVDLAVELQHRRTATFRQAALCVEATTSVINVVAIISGRRDP